MDFRSLDDATLNHAIAQTTETIERGEVFLRSLTGREAVGLQKMADSTPALIEKLRIELRELEAEHRERFVRDGGA